MSSLPTVCFSSAAFRNEPIEAIIPRLAATGYGGVEIVAGHLQGKGREELGAIRRLARSHGMRIAMVSPLFSLTRDLPEQLERSFAMAGLAVVVGRGLAGPEGPPLVRVVLDTGNGGVGSRDATPAHWERATAALRRITALDPGTPFVVETLAGTLADTPESALQVLDRVGAPNLGLSYQPGDGDPVADWRLLRAHLRQVHLHGPLRDDGSGYLEDGGHRIAGLLDALRADGYGGALTVEYRGPGVTWERADAARAWLRAQGF